MVAGVVDRVTGSVGAVTSRYTLKLAVLVLPALSYAVIFAEAFCVEVAAQLYTQEYALVVSSPPLVALKAVSAGKLIFCMPERASAAEAFTVNEPVVAVL